MGMSARLQKTASTVLAPRSVSGQSTKSSRSSRSSPGQSPTVEKDDFLPPPPILAKYGSSPTSSPRPATAQPRNQSPPSPPAIQVQHASTSASDSLAPASAERTDRRSRRMTWFGRPKSTEREEKVPTISAWVVGHSERKPYDLPGLVNAEHVSELWDDTGDCLVYLFPRTSGKGPSFRIDSSLLISSKMLSELVIPVEAGIPQTYLNDPSTPPMTPKSGVSELELYMPISLKSDSELPIQPTSESAAEDNETLVAARNFFAFLAGQSLVATQRNPSLFSIFMKLSDTLKRFEFSNYDGSTFGEIATSSFDSYVEELGLTDVKTSPEKTVEGIVLGERMKSIKLYNEAFTHAAGKHEEIVKLGSPKFKLISPISINRLSRAAMDLEKRTANVRHTLEDFDFPAIFSGTLSSKTADERKTVNFDSWRDSFFATRKFVMAFYKGRYGSWPPKASSKKNELETNGLNRIVLQDLYSDLCAVYDLLADRSNLTNRTADGVLIDDRDADEPRIRALRSVLSEYDRSSPPVKPPVPFDLPIFPSLKEMRTGAGFKDEKKKAKAMSKKLKDDEIAEILKASYNADVVETPFLKSFKETERKAARRCTLNQIAELRMGQWLFMYAVIQALPLLVVDGPELQHTKGVEYFLCESPRFGVPWAREDALRNASRTGVAVANAGGIALLPADLFQHGAEGIYFRSHCWNRAEEWSAGNPVIADALRMQRQADIQPLSPPPLVGTQQRPSSRGTSPAGSVRSRQSVVTRQSGGGLGLEVPGSPALGALGGRPRSARPVSVYDPTKTFDSILANNKKN